MKCVLKIAVLLASAQLATSVNSVAHQAPVVASQAHLGELVDQPVDHVLVSKETSHHRRRGEEANIRGAIFGGVALFFIVLIMGVSQWMSNQQSSAAEEEQRACAAAAVGPEADLNVEKLAKLVTKRTVQQVGPIFTKANNVKGIVEKEVFGLKKKAATFVMDELYGTVASILRECEAEEMMLLFDPAAAAQSNMPPVSILIAGLMSPVVLTVSLVVHLSQIFLVLLPVMCMCFWAVYVDWNEIATCAVPTLWLWLYVQGGLSLLLFVGHLITTINIASGKSSIDKKKAGMEGRLRDALADGELTISEIRELFLVASILLEHSLVVEDGLRRSIWRSVIGYGTIAWMAMTVWTFVLVLGWTFLPGMVAFHPSAKTVAGDDFCGAWASVFSARLSCVLSLLFLMFNAISVGQFVSDKLVTSEGYSAALLAWSRDFDQSSGGFPVMQTLVKAFFLRGNGDSLRDQIAMAYDTKHHLLSQEKDLQTRIKVLNGRIQVHKAEAKELKKQQGLPEEDELAGTEKLVKEAAAAQAKAMEEATKKELDALYQKFLEAAKSIKDSDAVKQAMAQAQELQDGGVEGLQKSASSGLASAQQAAEQGLATAQQTAQEGAAAAQQAAASGAAAAQDAADRAVQQGRAAAGAA